MKKLLTATFALAIFGSAFAQHTPPRPPRPGQLPPDPSHTPPKPKTPGQVANDVDNFLRGDRSRKTTVKTNASDHKYVKYNNGKHKGQYKKARAKKAVVIRRRK